MHTDRYSRQSFLGSESEEFIARATVAVAGLGGGGSHVVQQLAHIGFQNYVSTTATPLRSRISTGSSARRLRTLWRKHPNFISRR